MSILGYGATIMVTGVLTWTSVVGIMREFDPPEPCSAVPSAETPWIVDDSLTRAAFDEAADYLRGVGIAGGIVEFGFVVDSAGSVTDLQRCDPSGNAVLDSIGEAIAARLSFKASYGESPQVSQRPFRLPLRFVARDSNWQPDLHLDISTDSAEYHLVPLQEGYPYYQYRVVVTLANAGSDTLYLHRMCGSGDRPERYLLRTGTTIEACPLGVTGRLPIPVLPGTAYQDTVDVEAAHNPRSQPRRTLEDLLGPVHITYVVQTFDFAAGMGRHPYLPIYQVHSNVYEVLRPVTVRSNGKRRTDA